MENKVGQSETHAHGGMSQKRRSNMHDKERDAIEERLNDLRKNLDAMALRECAKEQDRRITEAEKLIEPWGSISFKQETWFMPSMFLPPLSTGDRFVFPEGEVWEVSGVEIEGLDPAGMYVRVTVWWRRPAEPDKETDEGAQWFGRFQIGGENWRGKEGRTAKAVEIWEKCGSSRSGAHER